MPSLPVVSAIVLNWNGVRYLKEALPSLAAQSYPHLEVLVVDNGSTEDSERVSRSAGAEWLRIPTNIGMARALNFGARQARGEVLLFLNNDMRFDRDFVMRMTAELVRDDQVFAVDAMQYDWEGQSKVHQATFLSRKRSDDGNDGEMVPGLFLTQRSSDQPCRVVAANGANLMVRRWMFDAVGGLDERMLGGFEDIDLCWRGSLKGWHCVYVPHAICWHKVSAASSTAAGRRWRFRAALGGRVLFATKYLPWSYALRVWGALLGGTIFDLAHVFSKERFPAERFRMIGRTSAYLPALLKERRESLRLARTTPERQLERMLALGHLGAR